MHRGYAEEIPSVDNDHSRSELRRLNHVFLMSFLNAFFLLPVYLSGFNAGRRRQLRKLPSRLRVEAAPEHRPGDAIDADHQSRHAHVDRMLPTHVEHFIESFDEDFS